MIAKKMPAFAFAALLAGCAGFTEDTNTADRESAGNSELGELIAKKYAAARTTGTGKMSVDETVDSVTLVLETFGGCLKSDNTLSYNFDYYYADAHSFAYRFRGDTLLLTYRYIPDPYEVDQEEYDESLVLVGGLSGELDGVWFLTQCRYREDRMYCGNDGYDTYLKLDGNKVEVRVADREGYDYIETHMVSELLMFLKDGSSFDFDDILYHDDIEYWSDRYNIGIVEKTTRQMKFTYADHTFDLNVDYASYDSVAVTLMSGGSACVGTYRKIENAPSEMCIEENVDYFREGSLHYRKSNESEFETCVNAILGRGND